jgi:hypothetical protein
MQTTVCKGLSSYLGVPVIQGNQTAQPPKYPYVSYTVTTLKSENNGTYGRYDDCVYRIPIKQTWSVTTHSDDSDEAMTLAVKCEEFLKHSGVTYLNDNNVIVDRTTAITNRDNLITAEYEYRNGFDVVFYLFNEITPDDEDTDSGVIEEVTVKGEMNNG